MLNRFKDAVKGSTPRNNSKDGDEEIPHPPKPEKYCYSRPHFLGLTYEEVLASRDFAMRPIMTPRDISQMPLQAGYAECINGGKSDNNEDQATATDLLLTHHFRTDVSTSCLDISLSRSLSHSGGHGGGKHSPGPGSPNRIQSKAPGLAAGSRSKSNDEQEQENHKNSEDYEHDRTKDEVLSKSDQRPINQFAQMVEMCDFVSSPSVLNDSEPSVNTHSNSSEKKHDVLQRQPSTSAHPQNHLMPKHNEQTMSARYFGLFDGHASHIVSLIVSKLLHMHVKEKLELCMGAIQRINTLQEQSHMGDNSTDITVEQLVIGALEEAFINMDELLDRERTTYHIKGGCTALVTLLFEGKLYVANAGDSRAVLCHGDKVTLMSHDFTAETEKARLNEIAFNQPELLHGEFTCYEFLHRVNRLDLGKHVICRRPGRAGWTLKTAIEDDLKFPLIVGTGKRARVMGTIGVSRCLGNHDLFVYDSDIWIKPFLSPLPEVQVFDLTKDEWSDDDVLIMGSDGLWDTITNEKAAEMVRNSFKQPAKHGNEKYTIAAQELVQEARGLFTGRGWRKTDDGMASFDDITVFVIPIKRYIDKWRQGQNKS